MMMNKLILLCTAMVLCGCHRDAWRCTASIESTAPDVLTINVMVDQELPDGRLTRVASPTLMVPRGESAEVLIQGPDHHVQIQVAPADEGIAVMATIDGQPIPVVMHDDASH